jgi:hypothetical protein
MVMTGHPLLLRQPWPGISADTRLKAGAILLGTKWRHMPLKPFLLRQVAECERRMDQSTDEDERFNLKIMHQMWKALLDESASMSSQRLAAEVVGLVKMQSAVNRLLPGPNL